MPNIFFGLFAVIGAVASVITLLVFFRPSFTYRTLRQLRIVRELAWTDVLPLVATARNRVQVLQTWLPTLRLDLPHWREALSRPNTRFQILLMDQRLIPHRLMGRERVSGLLAPNVADISMLASEFNRDDAAQIEGRFYSNIPFGPIFVIDDDIFWGLFLAHQDSLMGPAFRASAASRLGKAILKSFERTWERASHVSGELALPGHSAVGLVDPGDLAGEEARTTALITSLRNRLVPAEWPGSGAASGLLLAMRDATTDLSERGIFSGTLEIGINGAGRSRATQISRDLSSIAWDHVYSSSLRRAFDTVRTVLPDFHDIQTRDELRERSMGDTEGLSAATYGESLPWYRGHDIVGGFFVRPRGGGESYFDVLVRLAPLLNEISHEVRSGKNVLICTHETPMRLIRLAFTPGLDREMALGEEIDNCSVSAYR